MTVADNEELMIEQGFTPVKPTYSPAPPLNMSEGRKAMLMGGEIRTVSSTGGEKGTKPARYDLIPVEALEQVAMLYGKGAEKYSEHNWRKGYEWSKSYASLQRHVNAFWSGEDDDPEMQLPHLASVVFHAFTLMTFMNEQRAFDDRYKQAEG